MKVDIKLLKEIYMRLGDDESKEMFKNRLLYSITNDSKWIFENFRLFQEGKEIIDKIDESVCKGGGKIVLFGTGIRGQSLHKMFKKYPWKCFVDNYSELKEMQGLPVISSKKFLGEYQGEYIFITPKYKNEIIYAQLIKAGISAEKIINVGRLQNELLKKQYFDLKFLKQAEDREVFLDIGGFDGMTSVYFSEWSQRNNFSYIFEPDVNNIRKCRDNLSNTSLKYQIIPKGAWSEETKLHFQADADVSSKICDAGNTSISVTTIDKIMKNEKASFIKMDIEGAELQALIGAKQTISNYKPKLAISVYHKPEDIWEIPNIILQYNSSYKLYLRHYTLTEYDTILYALP
ncbi:MAG: FkbM family methyltransferase [Lachnospiraceae bacterium]